MSPFTRTQATWKRLFAQAGFPSYFTGMFVSLFGTGLNFAGVTLYVLAKTGSTVQVSFTVILLTLPRLVVPLLRRRADRSYGPPLPGHHARSDPRLYRSGNGRAGLRRAARTLAAIPDDPAAGDCVCRVLGDEPGAAAGDCSAAAPGRRERRGARGGAGRHAGGRRRGRSDLRSGRAGPDPGDRWADVCRLRFLLVPAAARARLAEQSSSAATPTVHGRPSCR